MSSARTFYAQGAHPAAAVPALLPALFDGRNVPRVCPCVGDVVAAEAAAAAGVVGCVCGRALLLRLRNPRTGCEMDPSRLEGFVVAAGAGGLLSSSAIEW